MDTDEALIGLFKKYADEVDEARAGFGETPDLIAAILAVGDRLYQRLTDIQDRLYEIGEALDRK